MAHSLQYSETPITRRRGFTLVELLVVVAVIALLIGLLLPALSKARAAGFQAKGLSTQKQLVLGLITYGNSADFAIPGINTSGRQLQRIVSTDISKVDKNENLPTQGWDWMTPAFGGDVNFPLARSERMVYNFREYADPAMREVFVSQNLENATQGTAPAPTMQELANRLGSIPAPSYYMPSAWQLQGGVTTPPSDNTSPYGQSTQAKAVVELPVGYRPRLDKVGQSSNKVAIADGHVNVLEISSPVKLDVGIFTTPVDREFGAFASDGPIRKDSLAYGEGGADLKLSYRHSGRMNTAYWDGHGAAINDDDSRNPSLWYPVGSMFKNSNAHSSSRAFFGSGNITFPQRIN